MQCRGSKTVLITKFCISQEKRRCNPSFAFYISQSAASSEKEMYYCLWIIVLQSLPPIFVEQKEVYEFCKHDVVFSVRTDKDALLFLVQIDQNKIAEELKETRSAFMYDGWTKSGTHLLGNFAVSMLRISVMKRESAAWWGTRDAIPIETVTVLYHKGCDFYREAIDYNAESHISQFEYVFNIYNLNVPEFCF